MLEIVVQVVVALLAIALLICFASLVRGPRIEDRVVAMDLISVLTVSITVASTAGTGQRALLDVSILIALVGFMGTVAYSWFMLKAERT